MQLIGAIIKKTYFLSVCSGMAGGVEWRAVVTVHLL
jgi:hypothetical protein